MRRKIANATMAALCGVVLLAGCSSSDSTSEPIEIAVPNVVGLEETDAWYALASAGLDFDWSDPAEGNVVLGDDESSYVTKQSPVAGTRVHDGVTVLLTTEVRSKDGTVVAEPKRSQPTTTGSSGSTGPSLTDRVEQAFRDDYGWPDDPAWSPVISFDGRDEPRITVVTDLADKAENKEVAQGICMAVASLGASVTDFTGVYVTAGKGGPFLAECDAVR